MRPSTFFPSFLALASFARAAVDLSSLPTSPPDLVPGAYIVELSSGSLSKRDVVDLHEDFASELAKRGSSRFSLQTQFSIGSLFTGAAVSVQSGQDLIALASIDTVIAIWPVYAHKMLNYSAYVPSGPSDPQLPPDLVPAHKMMGIDRLRDQGYTGKGVKVAVIDTGIDYTHPVFGGGGIGPTKKIWKGYDFVGDAYTGYNTPVPDNDPMDSCWGHGTGVASLIAGNYNSTYGWVGIAPDAKIAAYRVFGCSGSTSDTVIVQAIQQAFTDGNDIINLSLSFNSGWSESVSSVVADRIAKYGKIVTVAAGDLGAYGPFFGGAPGMGYNTIDVASVDATQFVLQTATVSDGHAPIPYLSNGVLQISDAHAIFVPTDVYGCSAITNAPINSQLLIFVVARGNCAIPTKVDNIKAAGGQYMLMYNNEAGYTVVALQYSNFQAGLISTTDGQYLVNQYKAGKKVLLSFPTGQTVLVPISTGGQVSSQSAWGPSNELYFKPNVAGVGGNVFAAWPTALGSWYIGSGTSFSAPMVAGASALLLQARGSNFISGLVWSLGAKSLFQQTAQVAYNTLGEPSSGTISLIQQGAGLIDAYSAVNTQTWVSPSVIELNDTLYGDYTRDITITALLKDDFSNLFKSQTYTLTHVPASTVLTWSNGAVALTPATSSQVASVKFSKTTVTASLWSPQKVSLTFTPPQGLDPASFPVFSGQIVITGSSGDTAVVSYMGLAARMRDMPVLDFTANYIGVSLPLIVRASDGAVQGGPVTYTFQGADYPLCYYRLLSGTPSLHIDLVDSNINVTVTKAAKRSHSRRSHVHHQQLHHRGLPSIDNANNEAKLEERDLGSLLGSLWGWLTPNKPTTGSGSSSGNTFSKVPIVGALYQALYVNRNIPGSSNAGSGGLGILSLSSRTFANGTTIPNGSYKILIRALKITGDPTNEDHYESWLSPTIIVQAP